MRLRFFGVLLSAACVLASCSSSSSQPTETDNAAAAAKLKIFPPKVYSGFDGQNKYRAPVIAYGTAETVEWSLSDPSLASLDVSADGVMLTTKKAGSGTLSAKVG